MNSDQSEIVNLFVNLSMRAMPTAAAGVFADFADILWLAVTVDPSELSAESRGSYIQEVDQTQGILRGIAEAAEANACEEGFSEDHGAGLAYVEICRDIYERCEFGAVRSIYDPEIPVSVMQENARKWIDIFEMTFGGGDVGRSALARRIAWMKP